MVLRLYIQNENIDQTTWVYILIRVYLVRIALSEAYHSFVILIYLFCLQLFQYAIYDALVPSALFIGETKKPT